ncbi:MAG: trypsin-like peptidase domain-containing protein [Candidatus Promineifilaceae bacterium]|nr:trypsin-like peptidase domain-containing protein [Candidatus Promineifilaceae bacterium]
MKATKTLSSRVQFRRFVVVLGLLLVLLLSGCDRGPETPSLPTAAPTATPLDTEALAAQIAAEVAVRLTAAAPTPTPIPTATAVATATPAPTATATAAPGPEVLAGLEATLTALYERANPAVVLIIVAPGSSGSGFVLDEQGHIVTNNHVISGGTSFEVVFADGQRRVAEPIGQDVDSDLAVLRVDGLPEGIAPLPLAEAGSQQVGQFVVAIGNPFGEQGSMSLGIISGLDRSLTSQRSFYSLPAVIQTDAPINPGNSGGPLLNLDGEVIGVNSAIATTTGTNSGVGFAIPVAAVLRIVPSLISEGGYTYPFMGVSFAETLTLEAQQSLGLGERQGAYVISVAADTPAAAAGLVAANPATGRGGDLIVAIDGQPIQDFADLNAYLVLQAEVGQTIELTVVRDGQELTLPLTLGARP